MDDLIAFLRARLNEDEQAAWAASPGPWRANAEHDEIHAVDGITVAEGFALSNRQLRATVDHIVLWDPARVLAEVEAKRRMVDRLWDDSEGILRPDIASGTARPVLELLALPYADHPDYREEWRP